MSGSVVLARYVKRRIKRVWDKIPCFAFCSDKVSTDYYRFVVYQEAVKVSEDILFVFNITTRNCWVLDVCVVVDGFFWSLGHAVVGVVSEGWLAHHFGDDDVFGSFSEQSVAM